MQRCNIVEKGFAFIPPLLWRRKRINYFTRTEGTAALPRAAPALFLQRIRNEAHRYAVTKANNGSRCAVLNCRYWNSENGGKSCYELGSPAAMRKAPWKSWPPLRE